jgi:hypothetical protein
MKRAVFAVQNDAMVPQLSPAGRLLDSHSILLSAVSLFMGPENVP